jgi:hypothetical protein
LILIQIGNKRTMRRGLRRLAVNNKYWPNERWADVLHHVRRQCPDHAIVLLGTGPEYDLNQEVMGLANIARIYNAADDVPIPRLVALLARGAGLITVDSGPAHAAAAVGCPLVVLFGKALPSLYRPWGTAGADVRCCAASGGTAGYAGNQIGQRDRCLVRAEVALGAPRRARARARRTQHMSWVTSTTPRLVTKKRLASTQVLPNLHAIGDCAVLIEDAVRDFAAAADGHAGSGTDRSMLCRLRCARHSTAATPSRRRRR